MGSLLLAERKERETKSKIKRQLQFEKVVCCQLEENQKQRVRQRDRGNLLLVKIKEYKTESEMNRYKQFEGVVCSYLREINGIKRVR